MSRQDAKDAINAGDQAELDKALRFLNKTNDETYAEIMKAVLEKGNVATALRVIEFFGDPNRLIQEQIREPSWGGYWHTLQEYTPLYGAIENKAYELALALARDPRVRTDYSGWVSDPVLTYRIYAACRFDSGHDLQSPMDLAKEQGMTSIYRVLLDRRITDLNRERNAFSSSVPAAGPV
jgi:hypothetical protein